MIVRQGHPGLAFYFILSGSVVFEVNETDKRTGKVFSCGGGGRGGGGEIVGVYNVSAAILRILLFLVSPFPEQKRNIYVKYGSKSEA